MNLTLVARWEIQDADRGGAVAKAAKTRGKTRVQYPRQGGTIGALRTKVWFALKHAEDILSQPRTTTTIRLKAIHAMVQAAVAYARILEGSDLEDRVKRLEAALFERNGHP